METRKCRLCKQELPLTDFYSYKQNGKIFYKTKCKGCYNKNEGDYYYCRRCGKMKHISEIGISATTGRVNSYCKACQKEVNKNYYRLHHARLEGSSELDDERFCEQLFRTKYDGKRYLAEARLIYIEDKDYNGRWEPLQDFATENSARNFLKKCHREDCYKLKSIAELYRLENQ